MSHIAIENPFSFGVRQFTETNTKGSYRRNREDYVSRFYKLVRTWRSETAYISSTHEKFNNHAFVEIVRMGDKAIPLIINELKRQPDYLLGALVRITGENPISNDDRGNVYAMSSAWIEWYNRRAQ